MNFENQIPSESTPAYKPEKKRDGWKVFWAIVTGLSILGNIVLLMMLIFVSVFAFVGMGRKDFYVEEVIREGPSDSKIVVIGLVDIIDQSKYKDIEKQLKLAWEDKNVRAVIVRVNSPGGTVSASDRIYNEIVKFKERTGKPVVAFMEGLAASGGYYTSVACDKIIAEPTTITGSIGVIMSYFVMQELLEGKLGIEPVVIKSGLKKDWPSLFNPPDEEQLKYLDEKIIVPAYERFVSIVAGSRPELELEDVKRLADGSIYTAEEAYEEKLIDQIGYLDEAIDQLMSLAAISEAKVVEYRKPFSLAYLLSLLSAKTDGLLTISRNTLHKLSTPEVLYLWSIH